MAETLAGDHPQGIGAPNAPHARSKLHLGPYPVLLPKASDPRMHLALVTTTLQVLGQVVFDFELSIAQILISIATCAVIEIVVTFSRERTIAWPASAMLTGNGIALILRTPGTEHGDWWSLNGWWVFVGCSVLAMASKYLIRRHGKHIFNPSNFALVLTFVLLGETRADPQVLWWGPLSVGLVIAFLVILAGSIAITRRVGQSDSALSFWVTFAAAVSVIAASGHAITARWHVGPIEGLDYWWLLVTSPEVLVFLFFMITDPKTAPRHRPAQVVYGTTIALLGALIIATQPGEFGTKVGILAGLVLICPFVALLDRRFETFPRPIHTARFASLAVLGLALIATALFLLGMAFTADAGGEVPLERRSEVSLDPSTLPEVSIAQDAVVSSVTLDEAMAEAMAMATAEDLMLEELALSTADAELAAAALSGTRLAQAETAIEAAGDTPPEAAQYTFDEMSATVIRTSSGPQVPPQLAIRVTGTVTRNGATEDLEATYTLVPVGGTFLITDAFDADGNPMGDRPGAAPGIEPATEPEDRAPGDNELDGLAFEDVTAQVGLDFEHSDRALFEGPAAASGGAAVGDYDGDGDPDVFLSRVGLPSLLLRNDAGRFTDVTAQSGLGVDTPLDGSTGALFADLTGDGILDLVVLGLRNTPDRLFIGQADHTFVPASGGWELPQRPNSADAIRYSAAVGDYDGDGRLDLFLAGGDPTAVEESTATAGGTCSPNSHADPGRSGEATDAAAQSLLLRNTGTGFEDRTADLGVDPATLVTMSARFADVNADTRPDLLLAGMLCTSKVLLNDGDGTFTDVSGESDVARIHTAHASSVLDADGDGVLDWYLTGTAYPTESGDCPMEDPRWGCDGNHLLLGDGRGGFTDATDDYGVSDGYWAWGSVAADLNLDGEVDLFVTNGFEGVRTARPDNGRDPERIYFERGVDDPDRLWLAASELPWPEAASVVGLGATASGKAAVQADFDGDGLVDILVVNTNGAPTLWHNSTQNANDWVELRLSDPTSANRFGIGSRVDLFTADGDHQVRWVSTDGSFQSGEPATVHFGLRDGTRVDRVEVTWPDGQVQSLSGVEMGAASTVLHHGGS